MKKKQISKAAARGGASARKTSGRSRQGGSEPASSSEMLCPRCKAKITVNLVADQSLKVAGLVLKRCPNTSCTWGQQYVLPTVVNCPLCGAKLQTVSGF